MLELLITLLIVAILAALAYPNYQHYVIRAHRQDGQIALLKLAARLESFALENNGYQGVTLEHLAMAKQSSAGFYELAIHLTTQDPAIDYLVSATPIGKQAQWDLSCQTLTLDSLGRKRITGPGKVTDCWN